MKKIFPPLFHACIDYSLVLILLAGPSVFLINSGVIAKSVSLFVGVLITLVNLFTMYEGGVIRVVSMKLHLLVDKGVGVFLIIAPWLFGFSAQTFLFHIIAGTVFLAGSLLTSSDVPSELPSS